MCQRSIECAVTSLLAADGHQVRSPQMSEDNFILPQRYILRAVYLLSVIYGLLIPGSSRYHYLHCTKSYAYLHLLPSQLVSQEGDYIPQSIPSISCEIPE